VIQVSDWAHVLPWSEQEAELATELRSGSEAAFNWLVTHYHGPVYGLVRGVLCDPSEAADVTQEVFLKAFRGIRDFRGGSSLKTWLYRIAVREALNHRRWSWRHLRQQIFLDEANEENNSIFELEDASPSPFETLASREVQQVVHQALNGVAESFRAAVILRDLEGMSYEEVAEVLGVSVGTVKSRILRGRRALREILQPLFVARENAREKTA
jgi:RNA polymerase sigma-70 factor (ECF subfamily)